ncbi:hypothetical protein M405DRAFT_899390 [Rhizopogon salebrosus TDB-379]|nr:hypothetical protein M405DRAFT_899390 [Rhizopogon salebrosus TDB-379]
MSAFVHNRYASSSSNTLFIFFMKIYILFTYFTPLILLISLREFVVTNLHKDMRGIKFLPSAKFEPEIFVWSPWTSTALAAWKLTLHWEVRRSVPMSSFRLERWRFLQPAFEMRPRCKPLSSHRLSIIQHLPTSERRFQNELLCHERKIKVSGKRADLTRAGQPTNWK